MLLLVSPPNIGLSETLLGSQLHLPDEDLIGPSGPAQNLALSPLFILNDI